MVETIIDMLHGELRVSNELESFVRDLILKRRRLESKVMRAEGALALQVRHMVANGLEPAKVEYTEPDGPSDVEYVSDVISRFKASKERG